MAQYDLPAIINKVLDTTNEQRVFYVGHSMGTTTLMAMTNLHPEINDKIILASLLAPVAFVEHMRSPLALIAPFANILEVNEYIFISVILNFTVCYMFRGNVFLMVVMDMY